MQSAASSTNAPVWRRDVLSSRPTEATKPPSFASEPPSAAAKARKAKRNHASVTLLPITPLHEIVPGAIDVDQARARVVYLAPLTCTAAEKYFARTKGKRHQGDSSDEASSDEDDQLQADEAIASNLEDSSRNQQSPRPRGLSLVNPLLAKLLAEHDRRMARRKAKQDKLSVARKSVFDQRTSYDDGPVEKRRASSPVRAKPRADRPEDDQIERLKRYVQSMPVTDEDKEEFRQTMKQYQRLQVDYRASLMRNHASPMGFNMEAAWNNKLLEERHQLWVQAHDERFEACRARKVQEDEKHERRIQETTTEHRTQMRLLREVRLRLMVESQMILPTVMLAAATQNWFTHLQRQWRQDQLFKRLRGVIRYWCRQRKSRNVHVTSAHLLINWLQKSVAVKTVAFRVFRGIRNYVRRVKKIQRLWKVKHAKRLRNCLMLQKLWLEQETAMVDLANEAFEKKRAKGDTKAIRSKKKSTSKTVSAQRGNAAWLTFVPPDVRMLVIEEYVRQQEIEFARSFRHQEEDLFPQLVQTLRDENPNKARSYIRAVANGYALLGLVFAALSKFPGAVEGVEAVKPFDMRTAPVRDLILKARDQSPPDETGARFG